MRSGRLVDEDGIAGAVRRLHCEEAFAAAKVAAEIEVYSGALHGWCVPDMPLQNGSPIYSKPPTRHLTPLG